MRKPREKEELGQCYSRQKGGGEGKEEREKEKSSYKEWYDAAAASPEKEEQGKERYGV